MEDAKSETSPTMMTSAEGVEAADAAAITIDDDDDVANWGGGGGSGAAAAAEDRVKGPWSPEEDAVLSRLVGKFGARNWSLIARGIAGRSGKSCRLRWCNQLAPYVKRKPFTGKRFCLFMLSELLSPKSAGKDPGFLLSGLIFL